VHRLIMKVSSVLNLFTLQQPEWGVREAAEALELPKSTMGDILLSLAEQGLLSRTPTGRYRLGWRLFELSQTMLEHTDFCVYARRTMHEVVERWGETIHLAVLDGLQVLLVEKLQGTPAVQLLLFSRVGARFPAHASSVGKVLLAAQAPIPWHICSKGTKWLRSRPTPTHVMSDLSKNLNRSGIVDMHLITKKWFRASVV
jgi:IclR family transcriptional regulator, KDG regulon repressor